MAMIAAKVSGALRSVMLAITIAWVVSWMVVESTMLDWRPGARKAAAYDLVSRASLEVTRCNASASSW